MTQVLSDLNRFEKKSVLSGWPMLILWTAMIIFACHACTRMVGAGDTWVAMACGRHFINHGVDTVEPFSANSHKAGPTEEEVKTWPGWARWITDKVGIETVRKWHPTGWVDQNWLTQVIFYSLVPKSTYTPSDNFSSNALVYWKFSLYIVTVICVYWIARILKVNPALAAALACFALFTGRSYFDIRPAGFSNLLVGVFILILVLATYRNILFIWLTVPLTVLWSNLHGGYIYVFIIITPFIVIHFLTSFSKKWFVTIGRKGVYHTIAAAAVSFFAMILFNPFHLTNLTHTFVISVSKHAEMWRTVNEWHPAFEWGNPVGTSYPFLILFALFIGLLIFWLFSRILAPRFLTGSKIQLESQKEIFGNTVKYFGFSLALFIFWIILLSSSLINYDFISLVICILFGAIILSSIYQNYYYIYISIPLIYVVMQITGMANTNVARETYQGRYIYPFILVPGYVFVHIIGSILSEKVKINRKHIIHVIIASIVSLIIIKVAFNPFRFVFPSWHTAEGGVIAYLKSIIDYLGSLAQATNIGNIWHPAFINNAEPKYQYYLPVLLVINILAIILWFVLPYFRKNEDTASQEKAVPAGQTRGENYQLAKIDLALIFVVIMTIYMAISSRRFIPIAAIAACPIIAMFIDQIARTVSSSFNFHKNKRFEVPAMSRGLQIFLIITAAVITAGLGLRWSLKFKRVYLDVWPTDTKFTTVFMRMTASDAKPFYAMKFIKDNKLSGKIFNYWTEGGFIAWGEKPDPNTGQIPLKLFIDGRAQAAYEPDAYQLWANIMSGGPEVSRARGLVGPYARPDEYKKYVDYNKVGVWLNQNLKEQNVWVVLMPAEQFDEDFVRGIEINPDWLLIFYDNKQRIYIDKKNPETAKLFKGVFDGTTIYPDEYFRNLTLSYYKMFATDQKDREEGLDIAMKTFKSNWSEALIQKIISSARNNMGSKVTEFCKSVFDDFQKNKSVYSKQNGFHSKLVSMLYVTDYLRLVSATEEDKEKANYYRSLYFKYRAEREELQEAKRW